MPICSREGFYNGPSKSKEHFQDNDEVFYCEISKEIFKDYEEYFRHIIAINSTVWRCEITGKDNLTYVEALNSEREARRKLDTFKDILKPPVILVIDQVKQTSLKTLTTLVCNFLRRRFFKNEEVQITTEKSSTKIRYIIVDVIPPSYDQNSNSVYEDTEKILYKLRKVDNELPYITLPFEKIRRQRFDITTENVHMFIKNNTIREDGILKPKPDSYKKYILDRNINFETIFIGKMPNIKSPRLSKGAIHAGGASSTKQLTLTEYIKDGNKIKSNPNKEIDDQKKPKNGESKNSLKDDMERLRIQKQMALIEQERLKAAKEAEILKIVDECTALLTKTDDLERTDQRVLPTYMPVELGISVKLFGDAFMLKEFFYNYSSVLSGIEVFKERLNLYELNRAFSIREVAGPLSDIILILLGTIFDMQHEEERECIVYYAKSAQEKEPLRTMFLAAKTHHYVKHHFSFKLNQLPINAYTLSEVLRLHFLSGGALVENAKAEKWRATYRNGYTSSEDPGLEFRLKYPYIIRALKMYTIYQLPFRDIMRIVNCLINQILTYSTATNFTDEHFEKIYNLNQSLKNIQTMKSQQLAKFDLMKRSLINQYNQECMNNDVTNKQAKLTELETHHIKKLEALTAQSNNEICEYEHQSNTLYDELFKYTTFLGMDRGYRKYYIFNSIPGLFIQHTADNMDTCLENPPNNNIIHTDLVQNKSDVLRNRKVLRAYIRNMYNEKEKTVENTKTNIKETKNDLQRENKENQLNGQVNTLANNTKHVEEDKINTLRENASSKVTMETPPIVSSQHELFMCTGDKSSCGVHGDIVKDGRTEWSYLYKKQDLEALIDSLNPLGTRESELRKQLTNLRRPLEKHLSKCPVDILSVKSENLRTFRRAVLSNTLRRYRRSNSSFPIEHANLNEVMCTVLTERILQFENDIYTGNLGRLKVKDMKKWRSDLRCGDYDPQCKLQWGPSKQNNIGKVVEEDVVEDAKERNGLDLNGEQFGDNDINNQSDNDAEEEASVDNDGSDSTKAYVDPGTFLGETLEIDSEDDSDDEISLHESSTLKACVKQLASALLQVEQSIEERFFKGPFGPPVNLKSKEFYNRMKQRAKNHLRQWELSLMESTSYSQVFLHLNVLHDCIFWARSTNRSKCIICHVDNNPNKMLLCDECNAGTHTYCMKPQMESIPEGNWYCKRCVSRFGLKNETNTTSKNNITRKRRALTIEDLASDSSSMHSQSRDDKNRHSRRFRYKKGLLEYEIEDMLENECNGNAEEIRSNIDEDMDMVETNFNTTKDFGAARIPNNSHNKAKDDDDEHSEHSRNSSNSNDDDNICSVCSGIDSELSCTKCKNLYHLECINLKRLPRYNFICDKCKFQSEEPSRKRKLKINGSNLDGNCDEEQSYAPESKKQLRIDGQSKGRSPSNGNNNNTKAYEKSYNTNSTNRRSYRRTGDNLPLNNSLINELLEKIIKDDHAWPFLRPVSQAQVPDYYSIIKRPMDFAKVKSKLNIGSYQTNEEVMKDIELIFKNCDEYNAKGNVVYQAGAALEKYVISLARELHLQFTPSDMNCDE